jgi:hypothetical protein
VDLLERLAVEDVVNIDDTGICLFNDGAITILRFLFCHAMSEGGEKKTFDVVMLYGLRYVMIMDMYNGSWKQASPV